jgi:hypothetical protein
VSGVAIASIKSLRRQRTVVLYSAALLVCFLLFCGLLRWQPWHTRLHLPLLVLSAPVVAVVLINWRPSVVVTTLAFLVVSAVPAVLLNPARPLIGEHTVLVTDRLDQYFANRPELAESYSQVARQLSDAHCAHIGLASGSDDWEYPLWVSLFRTPLSDIRIEHVQVSNPSADLSNQAQFKSFVPCAVVVLDAHGARVSALEPASV